MKQKNPNSTNLQFNNCKKVEVNTGHNEQKSKIPQLKDFEIKIKSGMLSILFEVNSSKRSQEAVAIAKENLAATVVKSTCWIFVPDSQIKENLGGIKHLLSYIQDFKSTRAYFKAEPINLQKFTMSLLPVHKCGYGFTNRHHHKYCWKSLTKEGWGCKFITSVKRHVDNQDQNVVFNNYWYNYGYFKDNEWHIDKNLIREILIQEVNRKVLIVCPNLSVKEIIGKINELPDKIRPDDINYRIKYKREFVKDRIESVPETIKHIQSEPTKSFSRSFRMKLDDETGYRFSDN